MTLPTRIKNPDTNIYSIYANINPDPWTLIGLLTDIHTNNTPEYLLVANL